MPGTEAYVDTSAFIALRERSDRYHALFEKLFSNPPLLVTSALVIAEGHTWFLRRHGPERAFQFLDLLRRLGSTLTIHPFDPVELQSAARLTRKFGDQSLTLADAHGLTIMAERRIHACWSTDRHLGLTGVPLVIGTA
ncbi:MAG TPA: PIN domain-containing protein [Bryobacteraceae bacterium]|jgi:predicted nucleic acid-binding protein|nr:PIN domain-containing protein [Bryobacteraceae bacterium]